MYQYNNNIFAITVVFAIIVLVLTVMFELSFLNILNKKILPASVYDETKNNSGSRYLLRVNEIYRIQRHLNHLIHETLI